MLLQQPPQGIGARRHPLPADPVQTDQGVVSKNTNELVLPPLSVGEMTLKLYGALNYCLGAQLAISVHKCPVLTDSRFPMSIFKRTQRKYVKKAYRVRNWRGGCSRRMLNFG